MISLRHLSALLLAASLATACDLNPQPLPPGDQPEGGANEQPPSDTNANGGTGEPTAAGDGGSTDGGLDASGGTDGATDGATDGEDDAPLDAGDASD
jgi:hypothetical protein